MKKTLLFSLILVFICVLSLSAQTAGDYNTFRAIYNDNGSNSNHTIVLTDTITFSNQALYPIGVQSGGNPSVARGFRIVNGKDEFVLNGNGNAGFTVNVNDGDYYNLRYLTLQNTLLRNFSSAVTVNQGDFNSSNVTYESNTGPAITTSGSNNNNHKRLNFSGSNTFQNNTNSSSNGGAVYGYGSDTIFSFSGTVDFLSNAATAVNGRGGAIYADSSSRFNFTDLTDSVFYDNKAYEGGAFYLNNSSVSFSGGNVTFSSNAARNNGGAFYGSSGSRLTFSNGGTFDFNINTATGNGGAFYLDGNNTIASFTGSAVTASENKANDGGAFYLNNSSVSFSGGNVTFSSNAARNNGGAFYGSSGSRLTFSNGGNFDFIVNTATGNGGAFYLASNAYVSFIGSVVTSSGNKASNGGFMYTNSQAYFGNINMHGNNAVNNGGAIFAGQGSVLAFSSTSTAFNYNVAGSSGGALFLELTSQATFSAGLQASHNSALYGGVIYAQRASLIFSNGSFKFNNNTATNDGGAVYLESGAGLTLTNAVINASDNEARNGGFMYTNGQSVSFISADISANIAKNNGGGIYANQGSLSFSSTTVFNYNVASSSGGAIFLDRASVNLNGGLQATGNRAYYGGAIYGTISSNLSFANNRNYLFSVNIATNNGGAIYLESGAAASFNNAAINATGNEARNGGFIYSNGQSLSFGNTSFTGNKAKDSGGAIFASQGFLTFTSSSTVFNLNSASNNGGVLYLSGASATFNQGLQASGNSASYGGAIYGAQNSWLTFSNSSQAYLLTSNTTSNDGGAIYLENGASASFTGASIHASGNEAKNGGFIFLNGQALTFSTLNMSGNIADIDGGGIYAGQGTYLIFSGSSTVFNGNNSVSGKGGALHLNNAMANFNSGLRASGNTALYGGAMHVNQGSTLNIANTAVSFSSNTATNDGGAMYFENGANVNISTSVYASGNEAENGGFMYANGQNITFDEINFTGNKARKNGGAVFLASGSMASFNNFGNRTVSFSSNTAYAAGGAVYLSGGASAEFTNTSFIDNESGLSGGAVFAEGSDTALSTVSFRAVSGGQTVFSGNKAGGLSNAVHAGNNSRLSFYADNGSEVNIYDAVSGSSVNAVMTFSGQGAFNLYSDSLYNQADIEVSVGSGGSFNLKDGASLYAGNFANHSGSGINLQDGKKNTLNVRNFTNYGSLYIDIFGSEESDQIIASGNVSLSSTTSTLSANIDNPDTNFRKKIYKIIYYGGTLTGKFSLVDVTGIALPKNPDIDYGELFDHWITLTLHGDRSETDFSSLEGTSFNQKQTAKTFDYLSSDAEGDLDLVISTIEAFDENGQKAALAQSAGYFLANVIRSGGSDAGSNEIYDRIKDNGGYDLPNSGLWVQGKANSVTNKGDDNSLNDYTDTAMGAMIGYDMFLAGQDLMFGVYGKVNKHNISQDPKNTADVTNAGLGVYGGYIQKEWEVKGMLSGSADTYKTERYIPFIDETAEADFSGMTISADLEGAMKFELSGLMKLRPYVGLGLRSSSYEEIQESGANSLDLVVTGDSYKRISTRVGVGINEERREYGWYISGEYKYLIDGNLPEIESEFKGTGAKFLTRGSEEGNGAFGIKAGGSVSVTDSVKLFANASFFTGDQYSDIYGNIGARWTFFGAEAAAKVKEENKERDAIKAEKEAKAAQERAQRKAIDDQAKAIQKAADDEAKAQRKATEAAEKAKREEAIRMEKEDKQIDAEIAAYEKARRKEKEKAYKEQAREERARLKEEERKRAMDEKIAADEAKQRELQKAAQPQRTDSKIMEYEMILAAEKMKEEARIKAEAAEKKAIEDERKRKQAEQARLAEEKRKKAAATESEISDEELLQRKKEADSRILKPVLKSFEVRFLSDDYALSGYWRQELKKQIEDIKKSNYKSITIEGHADISENDVKKLSRLRAKAVYDEFIHAGIPASKIQYVGLSTIMPASKSDTDAGKMANRRTIVVVE